MEAQAETLELRTALRVAVASTICAVLTEALHLDFSYLAVMTAHMVMAQYAFTSFQKGLERVVGRGLGIAYGLILVTLFHETPTLATALKMVGLLVVFYIHFTGRLAYTFLNCGLYLAAITEIGHEDPAKAFPAGQDMMLAIVLGVVVADLVNWLCGAEQSLAIQPGGQPLWPLRGEWLNHSAMLTVTVAITQTAARLLGLPASTSVVSVMMLTITTDEQALVRKGNQRLAGAVLGGLWGFGSFLILSRVPHFPMFLALTFLGMFVAAYIARVSKTQSYIGLQMGLVIPMVLLVPPAEFGTVAPALQRLEGVIVGLLASVLVCELWPGFKSSASGNVVRPPVVEREMPRL